MSGIFEELKRRNVFRVATVYIIVAWLIAQVASLAADSFGAPGWFMKMFIVLLALGFPVALIFAWAFELTQEGIKLEKDVDRSQSVTRGTGRRLDFMIIGILLIALAYSMIIRFEQNAQLGEQAIVDLTVDQDATGVPGVIDRKSVAVLPFANRSADPDSQFFVDGMHDDILTQLAKIGALKVISRTSVMEYRDTTKNMRTIGAELGVATLVEGGIQRSGNSVRINVQLIDANTDEHLWAEIYSRKLTADNLFAIQEEISSAVAQALNATLSPKEHTRIASRPTDSTEAYDLYLRAIPIEVFSRDKYLERINLLERAVEADPQFARAMVELGGNYTDMYWFFGKDIAWRDKAGAMLERAQSVDPELPELQHFLGDYYYHGFLDYPRALEHLRIARRTMPGVANVYNSLGAVLRRSGDMNGAIEAMQKAVTLDPRNWRNISELAGTYQLTGDAVNMRKYYGLAIQLNAENPQFQFWIHLALFNITGDPDHIRVLVELDLPQGGVAVHSQILAATYLGEYEQAMRFVNAIDEDSIVYQFGYFPVEYLKAQIMYFQGKKDEAMPLFQKAEVALLEQATRQPDEPTILWVLGATQAFLGQTDNAAAIAERVVDLVPDSLDAMSAPRYRMNAAQIYAIAGQHEKALEKLDEYLAGVHSLWKPVLLADPYFASLHADPAFTAILDRYEY